MLPWYVNGRLSEQEHGTVEAHLATCMTCQQDVRTLRQFAAAVQAESLPPSTDLYARTMERVAPRGLARLVGGWRRIVLSIPTYARVAVAAQFIVILALGGVLISRTPFTTLSDPGRPGPAVRLQVIFKADATAGQLREMLASLNVRIVDGPTSTGVYHLEFPLGPGGAVTTAEEALRRLRGSPFIEFVEVVDERR